MTGSYHFAVYHPLTTTSNLGTKRHRHGHLDSFETREEAEEYRDEKKAELERMGGEEEYLHIEKLPGPLPERYQDTADDRPGGNA